MTGRRLMAVMASVALACALLGAGMASGEDQVATQSATSTVNIRGFAFRPATKTVAPGTTVVFANRDSVRHTATRGGSFDTGAIKPSKAKSVRFNSRGTYRYHCKIHPEMRGKIVVD